MNSPFQIKAIDSGFYRLTAAQAKLLSADGSLPRDGWEKCARPVSDLNKMIVRTYFNWRTTFPAWKECGPIGERAQCWIKKTKLGWHDGKAVEKGWVWAIHIWQPA